MNLTNTDPAFVNAANPPYDFHPAPGSPAIDTGFNNTFTMIDYAGSPRPVNVFLDRGAFEYQGAP